LKNHRTTAARCLIVVFMLVPPAGATRNQQASDHEIRAKAARSSVAERGALWRKVPRAVDTEAKYLFYLHGRIVEEQGVKAVSPQFGAYEYEQILRTFADKGYIVISEPRPKGTDVDRYASLVTRQIRSLLTSRVPPRKITVVGASKGGSIASAVSKQLRNRDVNFVLLAACGGPGLYGNVLSIWDYRDDTGAAACDRSTGSSPGVNRHKEVELRIGSGHGMLYRPLKEWVDLVVEWSNQ
jgi:hypothetical protein